MPWPSSCGNLCLTREDGCQVLYSKQDASQFPGPWSGSCHPEVQSRVRNIASRAKEKQEANRQKSVNPSTVGGVVLREANRVLRAPTGNLHWLPSRGLPAERKGGSMEDRGIPEGARGRKLCADRFCSHHSVLQTRPSSDDKPEIYFLLRLWIT